MEAKTYYLGVESTDTALKVIDSLSFFKVVDMKTAQIKYSHEDRMSVGIHSIRKPEGAIIFFTGAFTPKESAEIEALAEHYYSQMLEPTVNLMNKTKLSLEKRDIITPHTILGKVTNTEDIEREKSGEIINQVTDLKDKPGKSISKFSRTIKSPHIHGSLAAGTSIITLAICSKFICSTPIGYLSLAIPPFIATIHSSLLNKHKEHKYMKTWYWIAAIFISTAVVIISHL